MNSEILRQYVAQSPVCNQLYKIVFVFLALEAKDERRDIVCLDRIEPCPAIAPRTVEAAMALNNVEQLRPVVFAVPVELGPAVQRPRIRTEAKYRLNLSNPPITIPGESGRCAARAIFCLCVRFDLRQGPRMTTPDFPCFDMEGRPNVFDLEIARGRRFYFFRFVWMTYV